VQEVVERCVNGVDCSVVIFVGYGVVIVVVEHGCHAGCSHFGGVLVFQVQIQS